jgi:histidine ammonia-lyase
MACTPSSLAGSVGASGDLAPLAHLALVLVGEGEVLHRPGDPASARLGGAAALALAGLGPITLGAKEGLAFINGTQPSTAVLALALHTLQRVTRAPTCRGSITLRGSIPSRIGSTPRMRASVPPPPTSSRS